MCGRKVTGLERNKKLNSDQKSSWSPLLYDQIVQSCIIGLGNVIVSLFIFKNGRWILKVGNGSEVSIESNNIKMGDTGIHFVNNLKGFHRPLQFQVLSLNFLQ